MPKIATKYYRRAKASTDSFINLIESDQAFVQFLNNDFIRNDDMSTYLFFPEIFNNFWENLVT